MSERAGESLKLGGKNYRIVPQGVGRIRRKLGMLLGLQNGSVALDGDIDAQLYSFLKTFVPDIAELHTLLGYESEKAMKEGGEPEGAIEEVTLPQLLDCVEVIYTVNGADRLVRLGKGLGLDADLIRTLVNKEVASWALERSASSPAPSGESDSESSTTTSPTSEDGLEWVRGRAEQLASEHPSPSPGSSTSSKPETPAAVTS